MKEANYEEKNCSTGALNAHAVGYSKSANGQKPWDVKDIFQGIRQCNLKKEENVLVKKDINDGDTRESKKVICDLQKQESKRDISCRGTGDSDSHGTMNCGEKEAEGRTKNPQENKTSPQERERIPHMFQRVIPLYPQKGRVYIVKALQVPPTFLQMPQLVL